MPKLRRFSEDFNRASWIPAWIVGTLAMGLIAIGCSERPTVIAKGDAMPVGDFELRVVSVSMAEADRTAPSEYEDKYVISVSLACNGGNKFDRLDLKDKLFDTGAVGVIDANDKRGLPLGVNWDESYETLTFRLFVHEDSGLTLLIKNVAKKAGQPGLFAVPLE
jgi:hypothetical protein